MVTRRKFIQLGSLASASLMVPNFLKGFEFASPVPKGNKVLVIVQLTGGNDGLNTIVPYRNDEYHKARPVLGIDKEKVLKLTDEVGLHPALANMKGLYDQGYLSFVNGVGYEHPNRSHFRSMDIWQTGSRSDQIIPTGWLGRYLDEACKDCNKNNSMIMEVDNTLSQALIGERQSAVAAGDIDQFYNVAAGSFFKKIATHKDEHEAQLPGYLYKTLREATSAADYLYAQSKVYTVKTAYPDTEIARRMKIIASLIMSNAETRVYYVSLGSFDTHAQQRERQLRLFMQLDGALSSFVQDLKTNNRFDDVLVMGFSEFGRRVAQNASLGTDHGAAGTMFFINGGLKKPGLYNSIPSLTDLDGGDLKYSVDFKSAYATVLDNWLDVKSRHILGKEYSHLDII